MSTTWTSIINTNDSAVIDNDSIGGSNQGIGEGSSSNNFNFDGLMNDDEPLVFGNNNDYKIQYSSNLKGLQFICSESGLEDTDVMFNFNDTVKIYKGGPTEFVRLDNTPSSTDYPEGSIVNVNGVLKILKES
jgi:hypothetical protein